MEDEQQHIIDASDLRKYRIELPNMADDDLDVWQFRLYAHYKRVGNCTEGVRKTAEKTRMSVGQVVETRDWLAANKWITVKKQGRGKPFIVTVRDRWLENFKRYSKNGKGVHGVNTTVHGVNTSVSPGERKKEPSKKEPSKKNTPQPPTDTRIARFVKASREKMDMELTPSWINSLERWADETDEKFILEAMDESTGKGWQYLKSVIEGAIAEHRRPGQKKGKSTVQEKKELPPEQRYAAIVADMETTPPAVVVDTRTEQEKVWDDFKRMAQSGLIAEQWAAFMHAELASVNGDEYTIAMKNERLKNIGERLTLTCVRMLTFVVKKPVKVKFIIQGEEPDPFGDITDKRAKPAPGDDGFGSIDTKLKPEYQGKKIA